MCWPDSCSTGIPPSHDNSEVPHPPVLAYLSSGSVLPVGLPTKHVVVDTSPSGRRGCSFHPLAQGVQGLLASPNPTCKLPSVLVCVPLVASNSTGPETGPMILAIDVTSTRPQFHSHRSLCRSWRRDPTVDHINLFRAELENESLLKQGIP